MDFVLFQRGEVEAVADLSLSKGSLMTNLEGIIRTGDKNESAAAFWQKMDHYEQYIWIRSEKAQKSSEIAKFLKWFILKLFGPAHFNELH